jgi:hypothetical protein
VAIGPRPTGFLDGYCVSYAPMPSAQAFANARGMSLPTSTCPPGSVVLPDSTTTAGAATRCLKACVSDRDCRSGYRCDRRGTAAEDFSNGACVPIDCAAPGAVCPSGASCLRAEADAGALYVGSRCVRDAADGGAASDARDDATIEEASVDSGAIDAAID